MPKLPTWDDVKKMADDLEKRAQAAGTRARDKWNQEMRPKLAEVQKKLEEKGKSAGEAIQAQLTALSEGLQQFQKEVAEDLKIGTKPKSDKPEGG